MPHRSRTAARMVATAGLLALTGCASGPAPTEEPLPPPPVSEPSEPPENSPEVEEAWQQTATAREVGQTFQIVCPAGGSLEYTVWGGRDGYYTDDSSICVAAVHAGLITAIGGGAVRVERVDGRDSYRAFAANGVTTLDYGPWGGSFVLPDAVGAPDTTDVEAAPVRTPDPDQRRPDARNDTETFVAWGQSMTGYDIGHEMEWMCPIDGENGRAWGGNEGYYSAESSICVAAVHAGYISAESGGYVTVRKVAGIDRYEPSLQNGVQSLADLSPHSDNAAFIFID